MNKFIESLKDMIYEAIDYIMILGIIAVVGLIIGWRLDILFKQDLSSDNIASIETENEEIASPIEVDSTGNVDDDIQEENIQEAKNDNREQFQKKPTEQKETPEKAGDSKEEDKKLPIENTKEDIKDKPSNKTGETISIEIPSGSNSTDIGNILLSNGLISNFKEFNDKSEELGLSTKLKAGKFNIDSGASLEEILNIITK